MNATQLDGITKARLSANIAQVSTGNLYSDDAAYIEAVCASVSIVSLPIEAADSYASQFSGKTILELETELAAAITTTSAQPNPPELPTPTIAGVPQSVTRRQGKTVMELSPHPTHGNLWNAALAAANAIPDTPTRIVTVNYLLESTSFDHPQVLLMAEQLLGMTLEQVDAMFITAATL